MYWTYETVEGMARLKYDLHNYFSRVQSPRRVIQLFHELTFVR